MQMLRAVAAELRTEAARLRKDARETEFGARGKAANVGDGLLLAMQPALDRKKADGFEAAAEWMEAGMGRKKIAPSRLTVAARSVESQMAERGLTVAGNGRHG